MGRIYTEGAAAQGFSINPTTGQPLDIRLVVAAYNDLISDNSAWRTYLYDGMVVAVVQDSNEDNNGLWFLKDHNQPTVWVKIGASSGIVWPENPDPQSGATYILEWNNGNPRWIILPEQGETFTFTAESPYLEGSGSGDGSEYTIVNDISSSTEMTVKNQYYHNGIKTADVVTVKDSDTSFHLMLNPDIRYILFGGDSEGRERVVLNIQSPIVKSIQEISGPIGLTWFISQTNLYNTLPADADLYWYSSLADAQSDFESTHTHNIDPNHSDYNNVVVGNPLNVWCIAAKDGWLDSYIRQLHIEVINDSIQVNVSIVDITRTTANENVNN